MQYILPPQSPTTPMQGGFPKAPNKSYWSRNNTQSLSRHAASHEAEVLRQAIEESKRGSTSGESSTSRKGKRSREEDEDDPRDFAVDSGISPVDSQEPSSLPASQKMVPAPTVKKQKPTPSKAKTAASGKKTAPTVKKQKPTPSKARTAASGKKPSTASKTIERPTSVSDSGTPNAKKCGGRGEKVPELWFCGWCRVGPMKVELYNHCFSCHRSLDGSATYASSPIKPSSK